MPISNKRTKSLITWLAVITLPPILATILLQLRNYDYNIPIFYSLPGGDEIWQFMLTKTLLDTGWVLENPYLGAPEIAEMYNNSSAQTSSLHSVLMLGLSFLFSSAIEVQQIYYLLNFSLIAIITYACCRSLEITPVLSLLIAVLMCFTKFRVIGIHYAYLSNYFCIPAATLVVYWIMQGKFSHYNSSTDYTSTSKSFWKNYGYLSLVIISLTALSDGYYAFFTLLLLGFAFVMRVLYGDIKKPSTLVIPFALIVLLLTIALGMTLPLRVYLANHPEVSNQDVMKQPYEAEVYSTSISLLFTPLTNHRIELFREISKALVDASNFNRKFPVGGGSPVILGALGSILLVVSLMFLLLRGLRTLRLTRLSKTAPDPNILEISAVLSLFILLYSIGGGLGTLTAFLYPTIRAYDRFPMFLLFVLYVGAGWTLSRLIADKPKSIVYSVNSLAALISLLAILDQVPQNPYGIMDGKKPESHDRFLAEKSFVNKLESALPSGSMVYQYPYSQYLINSKYYGWGSFGHIRFYLNSKQLRWSNGGAKGSPADTWHWEMSHLPLAGIITEMKAVGFRALVIDGTVLPTEEYHKAINYISEIEKLNVVEDKKAKLAYIDLGEPAYLLSMNSDYSVPERLKIIDPSAIDYHKVSKYINKTVLRDIVSKTNAFPLEIDASNYPGIFRDSLLVFLGSGKVKITSPDVFVSETVCDLRDPDFELSPSTEFDVIVGNRSDFDWRMDSELSYPIRLKLLISEDGKAPAERHVPLDLTIPSGETYNFTLNAGALLSDIKNKATVQIALMQDGNMWFTGEHNKMCSFVINN